MIRQQPPVRAVVFDFGGVIISPITNQLAAIAAGLGCAATDVREVMMGPAGASSDHPWHRLERGEIQRDQLQSLLEPYAEARGIDWRGDEVEQLLEPGGFHVHDFVLEYIGDLRERGMRTGLLSNSIAEFRPVLEAHAPPTLFDVYLDSSEVGIRKPDAAIYHLLLDRLDSVEAEEVLFLDDFTDNVKGAESVGIRGIHVADPSSALRTVESFLTLP